MVHGSLLREGDLVFMSAQGVEMYGNQSGGGPGVVLVICADARISPDHCAIRVQWREAGDGPRINTYSCQNLYQHLELEIDNLAQLEKELS